MKSRAVRRLLSGWAFAFAVLLPVPEIAHAAPTGIKVPSGSTFILDGDSGKQFTCAPVRRKLVSGRISRKLFFPATYTLTDLKEKIKNASGSKKKALQRKLASETARIRAQDAQCRLGPDPLTQVRRALTESDVRHLYDRAAFGAVTPEIINLGVSQGVGPLVDNLMNPVPSAEVEAESSKYLDENFATDSANVTDRGVQLWALNNLIKQPNPFHDRFAFLFLHNVLATSMEALTDDAMNPLMVDHLNKIRVGAVNGDYITLLKQISRDPVMLIWLNGNQNTKFKPNENFARELMELFTLSPVDAAGNINYSETTVAQVARACTGWTVQRLNVGDNQFVYSSVFGEQIHDPDPAKVIFEGTPYQGLVNNDFDVIDHIFSRHPDVDNYLAERILKEYLNETPSQRVVDSLARFLKANNFNVSLALRKVLKSEAFYDAANRNSIVAGPTDKMVKLLRTTNIPYDLGTVRGGMESSGQMIGMPPTVFGWDNPEWVNGPWYLSYVNTVTQVIRNDSLFNQRSFNYSQMLPSPTATADEAITAVAQRLGVTLTPEQRQVIWIYMNNQINNSDVMTADLWDASNASKVRRKMAGLVEILSRTNDFQMR